MESEPYVALLLADQLTDLGYVTVGPALSLEEARRFATAENMDLALLDFNLHGDFADEIVEIFIDRQIPFLFLTGYDESSFSAYSDIPLLKKPIDLLALQSAIEALLPPE